ncbi:hypothetical protein WDW37_09820 [Bdellovibrionota bacterium FG-1]
MNGVTSSPALLLSGLVVLLVGGIVLMLWGRKLPRQGDWLVGLGLAALMIDAGIGWIALSEDSFQPQTWLRGWIWPRAEEGAITVGMVRDAVGLAVAVLTVLVSACLLLVTSGTVRVTRAARLYAALAVSCAGVAFAWFGLTPWLALAGSVLTIVGGFLALGSYWGLSSEAALATRFGWERSWGFILSLVGLCVLAGARAPLSMVGASSWSETTDFMGASFVFLGAMVQLQPFPFLGWGTHDSITPGFARIVLAQVFPAWASLALLLRLEPRFREAGIFPFFGWVGLASAFLSAASGVFRNQWRLSLSAWLSSAFSLAVAFLAFNGPSSAFCMFLGAGLAASALAGFGSNLDEIALAADREKTANIQVWSRVGCGLAAAMGTGFLGFVTAGGNVHWFLFAIAQPALATASILVFFLFAFLGWKVAWMAISVKAPAKWTAKPPKQAADVSWNAVLAPFVLIVLGLGVVWTGTATGGVVLGNPDCFLTSFLTQFFGAAANNWGEEGSYGTASALYWGVLLIASVAAYLTAGKRPHLWPAISRSLPRFSAFVASGYGVDPFFEKVAEVLSRVGRASTWLVDREIWGFWLPHGLTTALRRGAAAIALGDSRFSFWVGGALRRWVEVPSKVLQVIQNGDVQWYLFFAVGSGIAILAHFIRT